MRTWALSLFWGNVIIVAEVVKWWAAKECLRLFGR